jgi:hypothetical protein
MNRYSKVIKAMVPSIILVLVLSSFTFVDANFNGSTVKSMDIQMDEAQHTTVPADVVPQGVTKDEIDTSLTEYMKMATGDSLRLGILERPFSETDMVYHPETDLMNITVSEDDNFYYFSIEVNDVDQTAGYPSANYAIEFDTDKDLKGDFLLWAQGDDSTDWNTNNVYVLQDANKDVGGTTAVLPDAGAGDGYETVLFSPDVMDDPDMAWKRIDPDMGNVVQLAIKKSVLEPGLFYWKAWADGNAIDAGQFDFNDFYSSAQAGSPDLNSADYPVKQLNLIDSTCWSAYGFQAQEMTGGCYKAPVQPKVKHRRILVN